MSDHTQQNKTYTRGNQSSWSGGEGRGGFSADRDRGHGRGLPRAPVGRGSAGREQRLGREGELGQAGRLAPPPNAPRGPRSTLERGAALGPPPNAPRQPRFGLAKTSRSSSVAIDVASSTSAAAGSTGEGALEEAGISGGLPHSAHRGAASAASSVGSGSHYIGHNVSPASLTRAVGSVRGFGTASEGLPSAGVNQDIHAPGGLPPHSGSASPYDDASFGRRVDGRFETAGDDTDAEEGADDGEEWWCGVQDVYRNLDRTQAPKGPKEQLDKVKHKMLVRHQRVKGVPFTRLSQPEEVPLKSESDRERVRPLDWDSHRGGRTRWYQYAPRAMVKMSKGGSEENDMQEKMYEDMLHLVDYENYRDIFFWDVYGVSLECEGRGLDGERLINEDARLKWYDTTGAYLNGYDSKDVERHPTRSVWFDRVRPTKKQRQQRQQQHRQREQLGPSERVQLAGMVRRDRSPEATVEDRSPKRSRIMDEEHTMVQGHGVEHNKSGKAMTELEHKWKDIGYGIGRREMQQSLNERDAIIETLRARIRELEATTQAAATVDVQQKRAIGGSSNCGVEPADRHDTPPYGTYTPDYGSQDAPEQVMGQLDWELPYRPPSPDYHPPPLEDRSDSVVASGAGWTASSPHYSPPSPVDQPRTHGITGDSTTTVVGQANDDFQLEPTWADDDKVNAAAWMEEGGEQLVAEVNLKCFEFVTLTDPRTGLPYPVGRQGEVFWDGDRSWENVDRRRVWGWVKQGDNILPRIQKGTAEWEGLARAALKVPFKHRGVGQKLVASQAISKNAAETEALAMTVARETGVLPEKDFMSLAKGKGRIAIPFAVRRRFTVQRAKKQVWIEYNLHDADTWVLLDRLRPKSVKPQEWISGLGRVVDWANGNDRSIRANPPQGLWGSRWPTPYDGKLEDPVALFEMLVGVGVHWDRIIEGDVHDFIKCWCMTEEEKAARRQDFKAMGYGLDQINDMLLLEYEQDPRVQVAVDAPQAHHPVVRFFMPSIRFDSVKPVEKQAGWWYYTADDIRRPIRLS